MKQKTAAAQRTECLASHCDPGAVGLVGDAVNLLQVIRVRDDLVARNHVLQSRVSTTWPAFGESKPERDPSRPKEKAG